MSCRALAALLVFLVLAAEEGEDPPAPPADPPPQAAPETPEELPPEQRKLADFWPSFTDRQGKLDAARYRAYATAYGLREVHQRLGPDYDWFRQGEARGRGKPRDESAAWPLLWQRPLRFRDPRDEAKTGYQLGTPGGGEMQVESEGEIGYLVGNRSQVDAVHTFEYRYNTMRFGPWFRYPGRPDGGLAKWGSAAQGLTDIARSAGNQAWNVSSALSFQSGLVAASGVCTSSNAYPSWQLPPHKVPMAVCVTARNEFILACVWDLKDLRGQLAVFAMSSWTPNEKYTWLNEWDWAESYPGMHNTGMWKTMKLLGYVDLPIHAPCAIATAADNEPWSFYRGLQRQDFIAAQMPLREQRWRDDFHHGPNRVAVARAGYAVAISKHEKQAVWIDLQPLFAFFREMYYTTPENYAATRALGPGPEEWPWCFAGPGGDPPAKPEKARPPRAGKPVAAPRATPRPVVLGVQRFAYPPTAVLASQAHAKDKYSDWGVGTFRCREDWTAVATVDGTLHLFDASDLLQAERRGPPALRRGGTVAVGRNPTSLALRCTGYNYPLVTPQGAELYVCARGEREIQWVRCTLKGGEVYRRLRDRRLLDPVHVIQTATNGKICPILTVADFKGSQVISYRVGGAYTLHDKRYLLCGEKDDAEDVAEVGQIMAMPGPPFRVSDTNVP